MSAFDKTKPPQVLILKATVRNGPVESAPGLRRPLDRWSCGPHGGHTPPRNHLLPNARHVRRREAFKARGTKRRHEGGAVSVSRSVLLVLIHQQVLTRASVGLPRSSQQTKK